MKLLITGNMGYVGSVLSQYISNNYPEHQIIGFDTGFLVAV